MNKALCKPAEFIGEMNVTGFKPGRICAVVTVVKGSAGPVMNEDWVYIFWKY